MNILNRGLSLAGLAVVTAGSLAIAQPATAETQTVAHRTQAQTTSTQTASAHSASLAALAASSETLETLTAALRAAGLVDALNGSTVFTVFAPTDEAFAALPPETLEALLQPENQDQLIEILTYHVVPGKVLSTDLSSGRVASLEGSPLAVQVMREGIAINNANVIQADIKASNGVVHVIDQVLLPPAQ
ncbi:MAG: fasciclin domain-containing protein [Cyanobacteria bacterium P01_H01_bin.121]